MVNIPQQDGEETQLKEFLNRSEIRTMRKDLQKLRENIALKQRDQIVKIKTPEEQMMKKANTDRIEQEQIQRTELERQKTVQVEITQNQIAAEKIAISQIKENATEEERQQIFYLETEKNILEKKLLALQQEKEPPLILQKNKEMLERNDAENRLKVFVGEEGELEQKQKFIEESEEATNVAQDRKDLEKKRWSLEAEREGLEKKRWAVEKDLQTAEEKIKITGGEYQKLLTEQKILKDKITAIAESIKSTYERIMAREQGNIKAKQEQRDQEAIKRAEIEAKKKEEIRRQERIKKESPAVADAEGNIRQLAKKEKLAQRIYASAGEEADERQKFLKRIDEWAEEDRIQKNNSMPR